MNNLVGTVSFHQGEEEQAYQKPYSEETGQMIDREVRKMIKASYERTTALLNTHKEDVEKVAKLLLEKEVLNRDDMILLLGKRPFVEKTILDELVEEDAKMEKEKSKENEKEEKATG